MYLIEYNLKPEDPGYGKGAVDLGSAGRYECPPNPKYGGRRIVECPDEDVQKRFLARNPFGQRIFVIPTDLLADDMRQKIREVVLEVLEEQKVYRRRAKSKTDDETGDAE